MQNDQSLMQFSFKTFKPSIYCTRWPIQQGSSATQEARPTASEEQPATEQAQIYQQAPAVGFRAEAAACRRVCTS
jgi:hypothetical protein